MFQELQTNMPRVSSSCEQAQNGSILAGKSVYRGLRLSMDEYSEQDDASSGVAIAPDRAVLKEPPLYRVIMVNDDFTPMEFVVEVLMMFFHMNEEAATGVMMTVHTQGRAVCGVYPRDIAETKALQVNQFARANEHPLVCEIEAVDTDEPA